MCGMRRDLESEEGRSGAVLMESRHGEGQTDKQGLYQRKRSDRVLTTYIFDTCLDGQPEKSSEKG